MLNACSTHCLAYIWQALERQMPTSVKLIQRGSFCRQVFECLRNWQPQGKLLMGGKSMGRKLGVLFSSEIIFAIVETMTFDLKLLPYPPTNILFGSNWTRPGRVNSGYAKIWITVSLWWKSVCDKHVQTTIIFASWTWSDLCLLIVSSPWSYCK